MKKHTYEILLWIVYLIGSCKAPAVSLSFNSKSKSSAAVPSVFAFRNGSWVLLNDTTVHVAKSGPVERKENPYKELVDELLRKLNLATVQKRTAATTMDLLKPAPTKPALPDKSLADLFFEWLNKQEDLNRFAYKKHTSFTTALPVLGLQIDLDDWSKGAASTSTSNSHKKLSIRLPRRRSLPFNGQRKKRFTISRKIHKRESTVKGGKLKSAISGHSSRITKTKRAVTEPSIDTEGTIDRPAVIAQTADSDDRKSKLNDLPKYVMRFLSQCKELIEQNYDDQQPSVNAIDAKDSSPNSVGANHGQDSRMQTESGDTFVTSLAIVVNNEDDSVQPNRKLALSKEAMNVEHVRNQMADAIKAQVNGLDSIKIKIPHSNDEVDYAGEKRYDDSPSSEWREGDYYDHLETSKNFSSKIAKVTKPKYYESEGNCSSCKPILDQFTPEREVFTEECPALGARSGDQTTLSPQQWKALMDFLNERVGGDCSSTCPTTPCPTFPPRPRKTTAAKCSPTTTTVATTTCTTRAPTKKTTKCPTTKCPTRPTCRFTNPTTTQCTTTCSTTSPTTTTCTTTTTTCPTTTTCKTTTTPCPTTTTTCPTTTTTCPTTTTTCPTTTTTCPTTTTTCPTTTTPCSTTTTTTTVSPSTACPTTKKSCFSTTCAPLSLDYLMDIGAASSDNKDGEAGLPNSKPEKALTDNKPPIRYSIMFDHVAPNQQHLQQSSHIKPKNSNWFDNIRSLKLLEGLRSPPTSNTMRAVYFDMKPYKGTQQQTNIQDAKNEDHAEKMIAEGVIPLKTGSTLNLYISYVLNRTKEHKNNDIFSDSSPGKMVKKTT